MLLVCFSSCLRLSEAWWGFTRGWWTIWYWGELLALFAHFVGELWATLIKTRSFLKYLQFFWNRLQARQFFIYIYFAFEIQILIRIHERMMSDDLRYSIVKNYYFFDACCWWSIMQSLILVYIPRALIDEVHLSTNEDSKHDRTIKLKRYISQQRGAVYV